MFHHFRQISGPSQHGQLAGVTRSTPQERKDLALMKDLAWFYGESIGNLCDSYVTMGHSQMFMWFYGNSEQMFGDDQEFMGLEWWRLPTWLISRQNGREPRTSDGIAFLGHQPSTMQKPDIHRRSFSLTLTNRHGGSRKLPKTIKNQHLG